MFQLCSVDDVAGLSGVFSLKKKLLRTMAAI